jgi:hypothetical protein
MVCVGVHIDTEGECGSWWSWESMSLLSRFDADTEDSLSVLDLEN